MSALLQEKLSGYFVMTESNRLKPLEGVRAGASLYVFLHHASLLAGGAAVLQSFGQEAVIAFFLLSGFVIGLSVKGRNVPLSEYISARIVRIYPVFVVALAISWSCKSYLAGAMLPLEWGVLLGNLMQLQDIPSLKPGVIFPVYYGNGPLWSLSYEWWFYIGCAVLFYGGIARNPYRAAYLISLIGVLLYQIWPGQAFLFMSYFWIWICGFYLADRWLAGGRLVDALSRVILSLVPFVVICALPVMLRHFEGTSLRAGVWPVLMLRHYFDAMVLLLATLFFHRSTIVGRFLSYFAWLAPVSFSIYALHYPLLGLFSNLLESRYWGALASLLASGLIGYLIEVRMSRRYAFARKSLAGWISRNFRYGKAMP